MNKKVLGIVAVIIIVLIGGAFLFKGKSSSQKEEVGALTIEHRFGITEVKKNPKNVVVLDYGSLDILSTLGVEVKALPKQGLPSYLNEYKDKKYVDIGGLKEFDIEKINELKPDLIIIEGRQQDSYEELSKIAPTIGLGSESTDFMKSLEFSCNILGQIFEKEDEIKENLNKIKDKLEKVSAKVKETNANAAILMVADNSISVYGEKSRFNMLYNEFGFKINDASVGDDKHGQTISYEYLLEKNPDYIFIIDKNTVTGTENNTAKEIVENELVKTTDTYKNNKIIYLDSQAWYVGGVGFKAVNTRISEIENAIK